MVKHSLRAKEFLKDLKYVNWHNQALWYVRQKRDLAIKSIPEWEELREKAEEIKSHTLEYLGYYLESFEAKAIENGIEVFWAEDAKELQEIVGNILKQEGAKRVVKSKSMLTEECELNPYLESQGIEVTDTDLGERIVQLANDRPSHIVLPAIHIKKEQVSEIFAKNLGTNPNISEPFILTREARKALRENFYKADAAITGVNFALAKEGGFVVCTNEGNADLGTALPNLHIACMGLEKVIPSSQELGIFTRLLARSATGQAITAYTSHFFKPRVGSRLCVVIVDNGRSKRLGKKDEKLLSCIRCGACMNTCPVYRRSGGHSYESVIPGPIGSALSGSLFEYASLPFACTLCSSCDMVCPSKIDLHHQLYLKRYEAIKAPEYKTKRRILKMVALLLNHPRLRRFIMKIFRVFVDLAPRSLIYNRFNIWGEEREIPKVSKRSFYEIYKEIKK